MRASSVFDSIPFVAKHFGDWMRRLAGHAGLDQIFLADALGISMTALQMAFNKETNAFRYRTREALLRICGCSNDEGLNKLVEAGQYPDAAKVRTSILEGIKLMQEVKRLLVRGNEYRSQAASKSKKSLAKTEKSKRNKGK